MYIERDWNGLKIKLPRKNDLYTYKEVLGELNQYVFEEWLPFITAEDTIIDLGAHIGLFSLAVAPLVKRVISLEPDQENFEFFLENINLNKLDNIIPLQRAIFSSEGVNEFNVSLISPARHSFYINEFLNFDGCGRYTQSVTTMSLSSIFEKYHLNNCKLIKADIEGAEYEAFLNCPLELIKIVEIFLMEYHEGITDKNSYDLVNFFEKAGFEVKLGTPIDHGSMTSGILRAYNKN